MGRGGRLREGMLMAAAAALSFALLVVVGWGEAKRTYPRFVAERMAAQAGLLRNALDPYLRAGLPLAQFPGFRQLAEPIRESDPSIAAIVARDSAGRTVFSVGDAATAARGDLGRMEVALPLSNRHERVGEIAVVVPGRIVAAAAGARLPAGAALAAGLAAAIGLLAFWLPEQSARRRTAWIAGAYAAAFAALSAFVIAGLVALYSSGAQAKAKALADSLGQRLEPLFASGLTLDDVTGLDRLLESYRALNPDVAAVAITLGGIVAAHSDRAAVGQPWRSADGTYDFVVPVRAAGDVRVAVALPAALVRSAVLRSVKNFAALFLACGLIAAMFLSAVRAAGGALTPERRLALVRPAFFAAVLADNLAAGFLPQLLRAEAAESGLGTGAAAWAFAAYFVAFVGVLLPASSWAERRGPRRVVAVGAVTAALALLLPAVAPGFGALAASRGLAGLGQGLLFIGVQAAVVAYAAPGQRTRAAAVIVFGFNGGMIAGAAIGSLLEGEIGARGVFALGAVIACALAGYAAAVVGADAKGRPSAGASLLRALPQAAASLGFMRAVLLVGAPAKAVLTGIVGFALPLVLSGLGWQTEDIGQAIMLYGAAVLASSAPVARHVDRSGRSRDALIAGGALSAAGLAAIAVAAIEGESLVAAGQVALVVAGVAALGLAHGCINAPVVTYVAETGAARRLGVNGAMSLYRVVERGGHVLGPLVAGQALAVVGGGAMLAGAAAAVLCAIGLFAIGLPERSPAGEKAR